MAVDNLDMGVDGGLAEPSDLGGLDVGLPELDAGEMPDSDAELGDGAIDADTDAFTPEEPAEVISFRFDPNGLMYLGHSQGGVNGPLFLAVDRNVSGGMLSAAGGNIAITLEQSGPFDIAGFAEMLVMLGDNETLDRWHPLFLLVQTFIEPGDPINYARFWFDEPRDGGVPKSIFGRLGSMTNIHRPMQFFHLLHPEESPSFRLSKYPLN